MAITIHMYKKNDQNEGEKILVKFLSQLPDTYWVYRELKIKGVFLNNPDIQKQPDFVVVSPEYGVIIIEVKDWNFESNIYQPIDQKTFRKINKKTGEKAIIRENPFDKAQNYLYAMHRVIGDKAYISSFVAFPRQSKNYVVSSFTDTSALRDPQAVLLFDVKKSIFREDIDQNWLKPENLFKSLLTRTKELRKINKLKPERMVEINNLLLPNYWSIGDLESSAKKRKEIKILNEQQQQWVFSQNTNQKFLFDVTGSGKTNVLISKAIYLIDQNKENPPNILLTTYNENLTNNIVKIFKSKVIDLNEREKYLRYVTIESTPALFRHLVQRHLGESSGDEETDKELLIDILKENPDQFKIFDHILIDEIQDFDTTTLRILKYFIKKPNYFFVGDIGQKIYPREFNLNALGTDLQKINLDKSFFMYRTPKYIAQLATEFILTDEETKFQFSKHDYNLSSFVYKSPFENLAEIIQSDDIISHITRIFERGYSASDIMIICSKRLFSQILEKLKTANLDYVISMNDNQTGITLIDFMNVKGLEKKVVLVTGIEDLYHSNSSEARFDSEHEKLKKESLTKRLIYIALTRSMEHLILLYKDVTNPHISTLLKINERIRKKRFGV